MRVVTLILFLLIAITFGALKYDEVQNKHSAGTMAPCDVEPTSVGLTAIPTLWERGEAVPDSTCKKFKKYVDSVATVRRVEFQREFRRKNPH
ncbi:MAG: hypothetical protein WA051_02295 [Minisyncoccia bacterium]